MADLAIPLYEGMTKMAGETMKIEIVHKPNQDPMVKQIEEHVLRAAVQLGVKPEIIKTTNLASYSDLSVNITQTPILLINRQVAFTNAVPTVTIVKMKMTELGGQSRDGFF